MRKILLPLLLLAGCNVEPTSPDKYKFERKEYVRSPVTVEVIEYPTSADLRTAAAKAGAKVDQGRRLMAFSELGRTCRVHIVDPIKTYAPEWIGHEVAHCFYGRWHD